MRNCGARLNFSVKHPQMAPAIGEKGVRRKVLRGFSYNLHYIIEPDVIRIVAVAHQKRHPDYWTDRLGPHPGGKRG